MAVTVLPLVPKVTVCPLASVRLPSVNVIAVALVTCAVSPVALTMKSLPVSAVTLNVASFAEIVGAVEVAPKELSKVTSTPVILTVYSDRSTAAVLNGFKVLSLALYWASIVAPSLVAKMVLGVVPSIAISVAPESNFVTVPQLSDDVSSASNV